MRLLNSSTLQLEAFADLATPRYAILSHRWQAGEVTFEDMVNYQASVKAGFKKLAETCRQAANDGYQYAWVDTCCIDKSSSAELSEAINSMYDWSRKSTVCYAYLADVPDDVDPDNDAVFAMSEWFKRGFTLQELVAPSHMVFFSQGWVKLGEKLTLHKALSEITGIDEGVLTGTTHPRSVSVAKRMSWAANRHTSRVEDQAYCLMGLFDVNMPMIYGEGEKAFIRLQEEIMRDTDDETLFAWTDKDAEAAPRPLHGLLAKSPACFADSGNFVPYSREPRPPYSKTNKGLQISLQLRHNEGTEYVAPINCTCTTSSGYGGFMGIHLERLADSNAQFTGTSIRQYGRIKAHEVIGPLNHLRATRQYQSVYVRQNVGQSGPKETSPGHLLLLRNVPSFKTGYETFKILGDGLSDPDNKLFMLRTNVASLAGALVVERTNGKRSWSRPGVGTKLAVLFGSTSELPVAIDVCEWVEDGSGKDLVDLAKAFKPQPPGHEMRLNQDFINVDVHWATQDSGSYYTADVSSYFDPSAPPIVESGVSEGAPTPSRAPSSNAEHQTRSLLKRIWGRSEDSSEP